MSIEHMALVYAEMLNDTKFRQAVASQPAKALQSWDLSGKERTMLGAQAKQSSPKFNSKDNKLLNYLIRNQPVSQACGCALGNAIGRHLGLPVIGPRAAGCDGGCCSWTARIVFAQGDPALR